MWAVLSGGFLFSGLISRIIASRITTKSFSLLFLFSFFFRREQSTTILRSTLQKAQILEAVVGMISIVSTPSPNGSPENARRRNRM